MHSMIYSNFQSNQETKNIKKNGDKRIDKKTPYMCGKTPNGETSMRMKKYLYSSKISPTLQLELHSTYANLQYYKDYHKDTIILNVLDMMI